VHGSDKKPLREVSGFPAFCVLLGGRALLRTNLVLIGSWLGLAKTRTFDLGSGSFTGQFPIRGNSRGGETHILVKRDSAVISWGGEVRYGKPSVPSL